MRYCASINEHLHMYMHPAKTTINDYVPIHGPPDIYGRQAAALVDVFKRPIDSLLFIPPCFLESYCK